MYIDYPYNTDQMAILKRMWAINKLLSKGQEISVDDSLFFSLHLPIIKRYYQDKVEYWDNISDQSGYHIR
jgi:hypothetical protein